MWLSWKIVGTTFQCTIVLQSRGNIVIIVFRKPGFNSAKYVMGEVFTCVLILLRMVL